MIAFWTHLGWSYAALIVIAVVLVLSVLASLIGKCLAINEEPPRREHPVADYSAQYREKVEWLGEDFLLAKPINRRVAR